MTQRTNDAAQAARFAEAVRAFTPVCSTRYAKLLPFKDGIAELRQKGASYQLIRELLATIEVTVTVDTIGRFVREVIEQRAPARPNRQRKSARSLSTVPRSLTSPDRSASQFPFTVAPPNAGPEPATSPDAAATSHTRTRGPRIADPANL